MLLFSSHVLVYTLIVAVLNSTGLGLLALGLVWPILIIDRSMPDLGEPVSLPRTLGLAVILFSPLILGRPRNGKQVLRLLLLIGLAQLVLLLLFGVILAVGLALFLKGGGMPWGM
jgi:hypothetical protein